LTSFCRHRRLESTCPICSRKAKQEAKANASPRRTSRPVPGAVRRSGSTSRRRHSSGDLRVRRLARAADDGYESSLVPGLRATADAEVLAEELAFAAARLVELHGDAPPGLYGEAARLGREGALDEALWLAFQIACIGPAAEPDGAFSEVERVRVPWDTGEVPSLADVTFGPRGLTDAARAEGALAAYRGWAARGGGQAAALAGEPSWTPERRFDRALERLALPGLGRPQRYEFLLTAGALGLADVRAAALHLMSGDAREPTVVAAKRVFGIGDLLLVARRATDLASACDLPHAALDLALVNWARRTDHPDEGRISCGSSLDPDPDALALAQDALEIPEPDDVDADA
jgi:hypothetical protein